MASVSSRRGKRRMMNEINVVPYIDVMLVLLVIFMVTAPLVTPGTIDLPTVDRASLPPEKPVEVIVHANGNYAVRQDGQERAFRKAELGKIADEIAARNPQPPVVISGDKTVAYEAVLNVMDELRKHQIKRVGLTVKPAQTSALPATLHAAVLSA